MGRLRGCSKTIGSGGILTVIKHEGEFCYIECSICSTDVELYPNLFKQDSYRWKLDIVPCGCNKHKAHTLPQEETILRRLCEERDYTFHYVEKRGNRKYVSLSCNITGVRKDNMQCANFKLGRDIKQRSYYNKTLVLEKEEDIVARWKSKNPTYEKLTFKRKPDRNWDITCPVCTSDMFSAAENSLSLFTKSTQSLSSGVSICRCDRPLNKEEQTVNIKNICDKEGLIFNGWVDGVVGNNHHFEVTCQKGHRELKTHNNFNSGKRCRTCADEYTGDILSFSVEDWQSEVDNQTRFPRGTKVLSILPDRKVLIECPVCKEDEYSLNNLCEGTFPIAKSSISSGCLPCRCSSSAKLTLSQMEYKINKILDPTNKSFVGWCEEKVSTRSFLKISCVKGTKHRMTYENLIQHGYRCKCCGERNFGFDQSAPAYLYMLSLTGSTKHGIKVGVSNYDNYKSRLASQIKNNKGVDYEVLGLWYFDLGGDAYYIEQLIKRTFSNKYFSVNEVPDGYTETYPFSEKKHIHDFIIKAIDNPD